MGSIGNKSAGGGRESALGLAHTTEAGMYDIEDFANDRGYDSAEDMILDNYSMTFFTRDDDMVEDAEEQGYDVIERPNGEYFVIEDRSDETESQFIVYYETAGSSRYITRVRKA